MLTNHPLNNWNQIQIEGRVRCIMLKVLGDGSYLLVLGKCSLMKLIVEVFVLLKKPLNIVVS